MVNNEEHIEDDEDQYQEMIFYPEVGVHANANIQISKKRFIGHNNLHFDIAQEILRAIRRISEFRWIHSKYNRRIQSKSK